jgi:hypothetical protein
MPDEEKKMVDIDTSGPEVDVELETQQEESEVSVPEEKETVTEVTSPAPQAASDEQQETKTEETKEDQKDELEVYSKDVQRRIAKLTKKWREAERQKEEALYFARIQKDTADKLSKKYSSLETNSLKTKETQIASALQGAKARLAQARESGDIEAEVEIQKDISRLGYEEARLLELKAAKEEHQKEEVIPTMNNFVAPEAPQSTADPKAEDWASKNRWFGTDKAMTYTAFDLHKQLTDEEGYDPSSEEYYAEIDKRIRLEFPHKFVNNKEKAENNTTKPTQIVASARAKCKSRSQNRETHTFSGCNR